MTTETKTKTRNAVVNNMSKDIKLSKAQLSKIIQSDKFLSNMVGKLGKAALIKFAVPLAKDILPQLTTKTTLSLMDNLKEKFVKVEPYEQEKDSLYSSLMKIWMILLEP